MLFKCSELNKNKGGNNIASNLKFFPPRLQNLGSNLHTSTYSQRLRTANAHKYHCENNKTNSRYPIDLNGQTRKYMVNDYSCENQCISRKTCFQLGNFYIPRLPQLPPLCLCVFSSSPLEPKKKKTSARRRLIAHASQDSRTITFFSKIHSKNKRIKLITEEN